MMRKLIPTADIVAALSATAVQAADYEVKMLNASENGTMVFEPAFLKLEQGDTVTFVAQDPGHNAETVAGPAGAASFNTAFKPRETVMFDQEGVYVYKCLPHAMMAMVGVIQVGAAVNQDEIAAVVEQQEAAFVMHKGRLKELFAQVN